MALTLSSSAFMNNAQIPAKYTCDGLNISPPLRWEEAPNDVNSFVLIVDDPDAPMGVWDHWILFNIPANATELAENITHFPTGTKAGNSSWGNTKYGGPCPPSGEHRYYFKLYGLNTVLDLPEGSSKAQIEKAMQKHVLAEASLLGWYSRKS